MADKIKKIRKELNSVLQSNAGYFINYDFKLVTIAISLALSNKENFNNSVKAWEYKKNNIDLLDFEYEYDVKRADKKLLESDLLIESISLEKIKTKAFSPIELSKIKDFLLSSVNYQEEPKIKSPLLTNPNKKLQNVSTDVLLKPHSSSKKVYIFLIIVAVITLPLISYLAIEYFSAKNDVKKQLDSQKEAPHIR